MERDPCDCLSPDSGFRFAYFRRDQERRGPLTAEGADKMEKREGPPEWYECEECGGKLWLDAGGPAFVTSQSEAEGGASGSSLAIPFALLHSAGTREQPEEVAPRDAGAIDGILICPNCKERVDVRGIGTPHRRPHFYHRPGQGEGCDWRTQSGSAYVSQEKEAWSDREFGSTRRRHLDLELRLHRREAILVGLGNPLEEEIFRRLKSAEGTEVESSYIRQQIDLGTLHWGQAEFEVSLSAPLDAEVGVTNRSIGFQATWVPDLTSTEEDAGVVPFVSGRGVVASRVSDFSGNPSELALLYQTERGGDTEPNSQAKRLFRDHDIEWETTDSRLLVRGAERWAVLSHDWDLNARELVKSLERQPGGARRPLKITPFSVAYKQTDRATVIPADDEGLGRFLLEPRRLSGLRVEIIPIPYDEDQIRTVAVDQEGWMVQVQLEEESSGTIYALSIDPQEDSKFLSGHRLTVLDTETWNEGVDRDVNSEVSQDSHPLGIRILHDGDEALLSPDEDPRYIVDFGSDSSSDSTVSMDDIELVVPPRFTDQSALMKRLTLASYMERRGAKSEGPGSVTPLEDTDQFDHACRILSEEENLASIGIRFGALGEVELIAKDYVLKRERCVLRLLLLSSLIDSYDGSPEVESDFIENLISRLVPEHHLQHDWGSEIAELKGILVKNGGPTQTGIRQTLQEVYDDNPFGEKDVEIFLETAEDHDLATHDAVGVVAKEIMEI